MLDVLSDVSEFPDEPDVGGTPETAYVIDPSVWDHGDVDHAQPGEGVEAFLQSDPREADRVYDPYRVTRVLSTVRSIDASGRINYDVDLPTQREMPPPLIPEIILAMCLTSKTATQATLTAIVAMWISVAREQVGCFGATRQVLTPAVLAQLTLVGFETARNFPEFWQSLELRVKDVKPWSELVEDLWRSLSRCASDPLVIYWHQNGSLLGVHSSRPLAELRSIVSAVLDYVQDTRGFIDDADAATGCG